MALCDAETICKVNVEGMIVETLEESYCSPQGLVAARCRPKGMASWRLTQQFLAPLKSFVFSEEVDGNPTISADLGLDRLSIFRATDKRFP